LLIHFYLFGGNETTTISTDDDTKPGHDSDNTKQMAILLDFGKYIKTKEGNK
jgi:hypothetical protein